MPDIKQLSVGEARVSDGDRCRLSSLGLPRLTVLGYGDVVCTIELFALGSGALHGGCVHRGSRGHSAGNREGELPSVWSCNVSVCGDLSRMILYRSIGRTLWNRAMALRVST